jgi:hypothetical protein
MTIGDAFRRLVRALKAAGQSYQESRSNAQGTSGNEAADMAKHHIGRVEWETSANDEVVACEQSNPDARLIAVASLYGRVQVRVCQKNMAHEEFRAAFPKAYTYGPGGSERSGTHVGLSFTTEDELLERFQDDKEYDKRRDPYFKCLPRLKTAETTFMWAVVNSKSRHFQFPAKR